jgi:hypothetical protein
MKNLPNFATVAAFSAVESVPVTRTVLSSAARSGTPSVRMPAPMIVPLLSGSSCRVV